MCVIKENRFCLLILHKLELGIDWYCLSTMLSTVYYLLHGSIFTVKFPGVYPGIGAH